MKSESRVDKSKRYDSRKKKQKSLLSERLFLHCQLYCQFLWWIHLRCHWQWPLNVQKLLLWIWSQFVLFTGRFCVPYTQVLRGGSERKKRENKKEWLSRENDGREGYARNDTRGKVCTRTLLDFLRFRSFSLPRSFFTTEQDGVTAHVSRRTLARLATFYRPCIIACDSYIEKGRKGGAPAEEDGK